MKVAMADPVSEYSRLCQQHRTPVQPAVIVAFDRLPELDLSQLSLPADTCEVLGKFLQTTTHVTQLSVADCLLEKEALKHLLQGARECSTLHTLNLKGNNIHGESTRHLASAISRSNSIKRLVLEWNTLGQNSGSWHELCESVARNVCLTHLDLRSNHLSEDHADCLASIARQNNTLVSLDLRWNKLGNTGGQRILQALQHNTTISRLLLDGNCINRDILDLIESILVANRGRHNAASTILSASLPNLNLPRQETRSSSAWHSEHQRVKLEHTTKLLEATRRALDAKMISHQRDADDNEALKIEIRGYEARVHTLEGRLETLESSLAATQRTAKQQKETDVAIIQDLRQKLAFNERALRDAEHNHERDEEQRAAERAELLNRVSSLQEQHASLSAQLRAARLQTEKVFSTERLQRQELEQQLNQNFQKEIQRCENTHADKIAEKDRALAALQDAKNALEAAVVHQEAQHQADKVRAEADVSAQKQKLSLEQTRLIQQMEAQRDAHARAQTSSDEALAKQVSENTLLSQHILVLKRRVNELSNDKLQLNGEVDRLNAEIQTREEAVRLHYRHVQDDNNDLRRKLQQLENDLKEKERQLEETQARHEEERTEWREREQRCMDEVEQSRRKKREFLSAVQDYVGGSQ